MIIGLPLVIEMVDKIAYKIPESAVEAIFDHILGPKCKLFVTCRETFE